MVPLSQWLLFAGTALVMVLTHAGDAQIAISFTFNLLIAMSAAGIASWFMHRPAWLATQRHFMGSVLGGLVVRMALEQRRFA